MALSLRSTLAETGSIALVLLLWNVLSVLGTADGRIEFAIVVGGVVFAALYAVVRGVALASDADPAYQAPEPRAVLETNLRAFAVGAPWFVLAVVVETVPDVLALAGLPRYARLPIQVIDSLVVVFAWTGTLAVVLVAVATGTRAIRSKRTV